MVGFWQVGFRVTNWLVGRSGDFVTRVSSHRTGELLPARLLRTSYVLDEYLLPGPTGDRRGLEGWL